MQLFVRFEFAIGVKVVGPFDVDRARDRAATCGSNQRAEMFALATRVENSRVFVAERLQDVVRRRQDVATFRAFKRCGFGHRRLGRHRRAGGLPRSHATVEHFYMRMTEELQEPNTARRAHAGVVFVEDDIFVFTNAAQLEHMMDHEHEGPERSVGSVDQTQAEEIEVSSAGNMAFGVVFGWPGIDDAEIVRAELVLQLVDCNEQRIACVLLFHKLPITLVEMALQIMPARKNLRRRSLLTLGLIACWLSAASFTYQLALPGRTWSFPDDHYSHPDFKTEWWYYTGHLATENAKRYGYQVTFFRFGLRDRQAQMKQTPLFSELYMAHFALSDLTAKKFAFRERINRGFGDNAGAATDRFLVWNGDWKIHGDSSNHTIQVNDRGRQLRLALRSLKGPILHGQNGLSRKGEGDGRASFYYSLTRMQTEGELTLDGKTEKVRGLTWMDHEFGSNQLREDQVGWDWFSIQLTNNTELMLYLMRRKDGSIDPYSSGTLVEANGVTKNLSNKDFRIEVLARWTSPTSRSSYPMKWKVTIPADSIELEILPAFPEQELITNRSTRVTYWEGAVGIRGSMRGLAVGGNGYVEMTGYAGKLTI